MQKKQGFLKGFTLIELLVVVFILGILVAIGIPQYAKVVEKGKIREAQSNLLIMYMGQKMHKLDNPAVGYIGCANLAECTNASHLNMDLTQKYFTYSCVGHDDTVPPDGILDSFDCTALRDSGRYKATAGVACSAGCRIGVASYTFEFDEGGPACLIQAGTDYQAGEIGLCSGCP